MHVVKVDLGDRGYRILIGAGARQELARVVRDLPGVARVAVIADQQVADLHLAQAIAGVKPVPMVLPFPPGENSKSLREVERLYAELAAARIGRRDLIVTLGGGVAGDLGGYVAATWLRGVRFVQMPTTLLAAIDASIGGKTGVNHPRGKNLIGAFHQPCAVIVDVDFLKTLPQPEYVAGLAESIKHAVVGDPAFFEWQEQRADQMVAREPEALAELIARNCEIKADVVARDEHEENLRMILNYGHTIGHALEHLLGYELRHGQCVGLGMIVENELACQRGILAREVADRVAGLIGRMGLLTHLPKTLDPQEVTAVCGMDKKVRGGAMNFVLVRGLGKPESLVNISDEEITAALRVVQPT